MKRDYYLVLGVNRQATTQEIKRAFRAIARDSHPDRHPDDPTAEARFKEASEAYATLADEDKRRLYDRMGHAAFEKAGPGGAAEPMDFGAITDILDGLLGDMIGGRRSRGSQAPADIEHELTISFTEAALGCTKSIKVTRPRRCDGCGGSGATEKSRTQPCRACRGRGQVRAGKGIFNKQEVCLICRGTGSEIEDPCDKCDGAGVVEAEEGLEVRIPPGVEDGAVRTLRGSGPQGKRVAGDLHVHIKVEDDEFFRREGPDIHCNLPVTYPEAVLGTTLSVPTLSGEVQMKLPPGTPSGKVFRLRGKGIATLAGYGKGDQLVTIVVEIPEDLSREQRGIIEELARSFRQGGRTPRKGLVGRLRSLWE